MKINHNMAAIRTLNSLTKADNTASKTMQRLSSGLRINSAADDAAGLAIAKKMETQIAGLNQANRNSMDGISMLQTAEGALEEVHSMLQRMRELTVQAANGTNGDDEKAAIIEEISQLQDEISAIQDRTEFNKMGLLGTNDNFILQVGANENQSLTVPGSELNLDNVIKELGVKGELTNDVQNNSDAALNKLDAAITATSLIRSKMGAYQNRLEHTVSNLDTSEVNLTAAFSRVMDADMAEEMTNYTQQNVLSQAANAMLAQANQRPQQILQLLS